MAWSNLTTFLLNYLSTTPGFQRREHGVHPHNSVRSHSDVPLAPPFKVGLLPRLAGSGFQCSDTVSNRVLPIGALCYRAASRLVPGNPLGKRLKRERSRRLGRPLRPALIDDYYILRLTTSPALPSLHGP